nr:type VI secretion system baseplate subunit TssE [Rubellimicrobium arenae]
MATRTAELGRELGTETLGRLLAAGRRGVEQEPGLDDLHRRELRDLIAMRERQAFLKDRGIVVTPDVLREAVRRDIEALFNVERFECDPLLTDAERAHMSSAASLIREFPEARRSVLNYGVPAFAGRRARDFDPDRLSRELREVVAVYEPRLRSDTIVVRVATNDRTGLRIELEGLLLLSPVPERLRLSTMIDLDSGRAATQLAER